MSTQTRVSKGIREGGQYQATAHAESPVSLTIGGSPAAGPTAGEEIEALVAGRIRDVGPGMEPSIRQELDQIESEGGKLLWARYQLGPNSQWHRNQARLKPEEADAVHELGFESSEDVERAAEVGAMPRDLIELGIDRDRVDALAEAFPDPQGWASRPLSDYHHRWYREAVATAAVEDVIAIHGGPEHHAEKFRDMVGLVDPDRAERVQQFIDADCPRTDWVTSGHSPEDLMAMARAGGRGKPSDRNIQMALHRLNEGLVPEDLRDFGTRFVDRFGAESVRDLRQNRISPKAVKSVHHALAFDTRPNASQATWSAGHGPVQVYARLVNAGVTTTDTASKLRETAVDVDAAVGIMSTLGADRAHEYRRALADAGDAQPFSKLRVRALAAFDRAGHSPDELVDGAKQIERASLQHVQQPAKQDPLSNVAFIMAAGVSADRVQEMSRAGIPPSSFGVHKSADDLWAAGAPYRETYADVEARLAEQWGTWHGEARPWPWTEETYAG